MPESSSPARPVLEELQGFAEIVNQSPTVQMLGAKVTFPSLDRVRITIDPIKDFHRGGLGTDAINGGVLAALYDFAIGMTSALVNPNRRSATMNLAMQFEQPVRGNRIYAESFIHHAGVKTLFSGAEIYDEEGRVCSRCQGMVKLGSKSR